MSSLSLDKLERGRQMDNVRGDLNLVALRPLDLRRCRSVGDLVRGLARCSFGARMLGEVANTLGDWAVAGTEVNVLATMPFERNPLGDLILAVAKPFQWSVVVGAINQVLETDGPTLVIGRFSEAEEPCLFHSPGRLIFINQEGLCRPGQVRDGYFPDAVFADPRLVVPILVAALEERLGLRTQTISELFTTLPLYGGLAAAVVQGAKVLQAMVADSDCTVLMTASGALTVAQLDYLFCEMIEAGMIQYLSATGALMGHGLVKGVGCYQYKHDPRHSDERLAAEQLNRVTDTLEPEENFTKVDHVMTAVLDRLVRLTDRPVVGSHQIYSAAGAYLAGRYPGQRAILRSAYKAGVPVVTPAFSDSELGNDLYCFNRLRERMGQPALRLDPEQDTRLLVGLTLGAKRLGIFSLGGGTTRNHTQNQAPLIEIAKARGVLPPTCPDRVFSYGCRICPDPMWLGHLSGCTYSEGATWRKMDPRGRFAEIKADATIVWPLLLQWLLEQNRA